MAPWRAPLRKFMNSKRAHIELTGYLTAQCCRLSLLQFQRIGMIDCN